MRQYKKRDTEELGEHYFCHVEAMTAEGLYEKSDIAAELAYRDMVIDGMLKVFKEVDKWAATVHGYTHETAPMFREVRAQIQKVEKGE